jgi:hypothetical protein
LQEVLRECADTALSRHLSSTSTLVDGKLNWRELTRNRQQAAHRALDVAPDLGPDDLLLCSRKVRRYLWHEPDTCETHHVFEITQADVICPEIEDPNEDLNGRGHVFAGTAYLVLISLRIHTPNSPAAATRSSLSDESSQFLDNSSIASAPSCGTQTPVLFNKCMYSPSLTHISSSQADQQPEPAIPMARGGPCHLHHNKHFRGLSMMTRSRVLAAAGMHNGSDHVSESWDSDDALAACSVRGTEATGCVLCSRDSLHLTNPTDTEGGELHYQHERRLCTNKVILCLGPSLHPLELRCDARHEAHRLLCVLQVHPEPLIPQELLLVNGIIHANGQVKPLI